MIEPGIFQPQRRLRGAGRQLLTQDIGNVIRAESTGPARFLLHPFAVSAYTAAFCFLLVVIIHSRATAETNERHLAEWREVAAQTASLDPL